VILVVRHTLRPDMCCDAVFDFGEDLGHRLEPFVRLNTRATASVVCGSDHMIANLAAAL